MAFALFLLICNFLCFVLHVGIQNSHVFMVFGLAMKNALLNKTCILHAFLAKMHAFSKI